MEDAAKKLVAETDKNRQTFRTFFKGDSPDSELFDIIYNKSKMNEKNIIKSIINIAKLRNLI